MPCNGPIRRPAAIALSACRAWMSASSPVTVMNAFSLGLSSAIFDRHSSVSFSDVIRPAAARAVTSLIVCINRRVLVGIVVPVRRAQAFGGLRQAVEHRDEFRESALFRVRLRGGKPFSNGHSFTDTDTPSPTCRNDV